MELLKRIANLIGIDRCVDCGSTDAPFGHTLTEDRWCADCYPGY